MTVTFPHWSEIYAQTSHRHPTDDTSATPSATPGPAARGLPVAAAATASTTTTASLGRGGTTLIALQDEYRAWLDNLPASLEGSRQAEKLQVITEFDIEELCAIDPPRGYGRD